MVVNDINTRALVAAQLAAALIGRSELATTEAEALRIYWAIAQQLAGPQKGSPGAPG